MTEPDTSHVMQLDETITTRRFIIGDPTNNPTAKDAEEAIWAARKQYHRDFDTVTPDDFTSMLKFGTVGDVGTFYYTFKTNARGEKTHD